MTDLKKGFNFVRVTPECDEGSGVKQIDVGQALQVQADGKNHFFVVQCLELKFHMEISDMYIDRNN